jgi:hypothetical protein
MTFGSDWRALVATIGNGRSRELREKRGPEGEWRAFGDQEAVGGDAEVA